MTNWYVGQRVVCVRSPRPLKGDPRHPESDIRAADWQEPQSGQVYTISKIWPWHEEKSTFWVDEINDKSVSFHEEMFRPLAH